jgi:hypothetical protein
MLGVTLSPVTVNGQLVGTASGQEESPPRVSREICGYLGPSGRRQLSDGECP